MLTSRLKVRNVLIEERYYSRSWKFYYGWELNN